MVAAVIVLYKPNSLLVDQVLRSVVSQVGHVFAIDNTPGRVTPPTPLFSELGVTYIALTSNRGIARAQNIGIQESLAAGFTHVLLLDQDSILPAELVERLLNAEIDLLHRGVQLAAVGPLALDRKNGKRYGAVRHHWFHTEWISIDEGTDTPVPTDYLNASGSLIRSTVFERVGPMMENLFIDAVDTEWGLRALSLGYCSYVVPTAVMDHDLGNDVAHLLGRDIIVHSDLRNYYIVRNNIYLLRLASMGCKWKTFALYYVPKYVLVHSWLSNRRWTSFKLLLRAIFDGALGRVGPLDEDESMQ